ncbi:hypothetical protein RAM19_06660 [Bartonella apihabitans]|nr:hypothetical protein [Bartonella apihabitans]WLT07811.1 hypothetical protein RAM19_06660 [Bartonella apihabitans]
MTIKNVCVLNAFLFYGLEVNNHAVGYLVRTILTVLDVLQCFVHPLLSLDFYGKAKLNRKAAAELEQKKHEETAE